MAMFIDVAQCTNCAMCEPVCPTESIKEAKGAYLIDAASCNECDDEADSPQCVDSCPVDGCITYQ